jgi:hypothetical protein
MPDGTLLAAAGDVVVVREPGAQAWTASAVAPLGLSVRKLAGTRTADGALRVLAVVGTTGDRVVLVGDREGWGAVSAPGLDHVADADLDAASGTLWVGGSADGKPAVARVAQPAVAAAAPAPPLLDAATDSIARLAG